MVYISFNKPRKTTTSTELTAGRPVEKEKFDSKIHLGRRRLTWTWAIFLFLLPKTCFFLHLHHNWKDIFSLVHKLSHSKTKIELGADICLGWRQPFVMWFVLRLRK